jgi:hypothetical protein
MISVVARSKDVHRLRSRRGGRQRSSGEGGEAGSAEHESYCI